MLPWVHGRSDICSPKILLIVKIQMKLKLTSFLPVEHIKSRRSACDCILSTLKLKFDWLVYKL